MSSEVAAVTYANLERRTTELEGRLADIDFSYRESMLALLRVCVGSRIESARLIDHANRMGRGMELIMERLGVTGCPIGTVSSVSATEVDEIIDAVGLYAPLRERSKPQPDTGQNSSETDPSA
jgi:hypothetical protein